MFQSSYLVFSFIQNLNTLVMWIYLKNKQKTVCIHGINKKYGGTKNCATVSNF